MKLIQVASAVSLSLGRAVNSTARNSCLKSYLRHKKSSVRLWGLAEAVNQTGTRVCGLVVQQGVGAVYITKEAMYAKKGACT
jgi:hypothetical protein